VLADLGSIEVEDEVGVAVGDKSILELGSPPVADAAHEHRGSPAGVRAVDVEVAVVRRAGAHGRASAAVVDGSAGSPGS